MVQCLGWEDPMEKETATHSNNLSWRIPWTEEPGGLHSMGLPRVRHTTKHACMHLSIIMQVLHWQVNQLQIENIWGGGGEFQKVSESKT